MTLIILEPGPTPAAPWRISFFSTDEDGPRLCSSVEAPWTEARAIVVNFGNYLTDAGPAATTEEIPLPGDVH